MEKTPSITAEEIINRYSALLLDAYGVLLHEGGALPGAVDLIGELNRIGKPYFILTNDASRLPESSAQRYQSFGLAIGPDRVITSGSLLGSYFREHNLRGAASAVLGTQDSVRYVENAGGRVVPPAEPFEVLVIGDQSGFPYPDAPDSALSTLLRQLDRGYEVHLILPNPDLIYPTGEGFGFASGTLALMFEAVLKLRYPNRADLGFVRLGKPHAAMYAEAQRRSRTSDMIMIGDQLVTDISGANDFGIDSALVGTSVTAMTDIPEHIRPKYLLRSLALPV